MEFREIIGNTTATPVPQSNWDQNDAAKPDYIKNKIPLQNGTGVQSIEYADGVANGAYAIAGGTANKDVFTSLVGDTLTDQITVSAPEANADLSIALGVNNKSNAPGSFTLGVSNTTGITGYYWNTINFEGDDEANPGCPTITLSAKRPYCSVEFKFSLPPYEIISHNEEVIPDGGWSTLDWQVGDNICIMNKGNMHSMCSTILAVSGNKITVDSLPFKKNDYTSFVEGYANISMPYPYEVEYILPHDRTIFAVKIDDSTDSTAESRYVIRHGVVEASLGFGALAIGGKNASIGILAHAEGFNTLAANNFDHAEGNGVIVSGGCAHGEGKETESSGYAAHAEGQGTKSIATAAHAEGYHTIANRGYAHAEGYETIAGWDTAVDGKGDGWTGCYAHAEGEKTKALHYAAHAEGKETEARGNSSHAQGVGTIAKEEAQHVQGKYNADAPGKAFIIGGGNKNPTTKVITRRNIVEIDWDGNASFAGDVTAGGKKLVTEEYVDNAVDNIDIPEVDLTGYATEEYVNNAVSNIDIPEVDLTGYATEDYVKKSYVIAGMAPNSKLGLNATAEGFQTVANRGFAHAEGYKTLAGQLVDENGDYIGVYTGENAHAEGQETKAISYGAHAEGFQTEANRLYTHAEGYKTLAGYDQEIVNEFNVDITDDGGGRGSYSHSEGQESKALNYSAHAEGYQTIAFGNCSHSGGSNSYSIGTGSFAHGLHVAAKEEYQFVIGKHNADSADALFIVGNGVTDTDISNAFEVISDSEGSAIKVGDAILREEFIATLVDRGLSIKLIPVAELPIENIDESAIYLLSSDNPDEINKYDEYVYTDGAWEQIGSSSVEINLDGYVEKDDSTSNNAPVVYTNDENTKHYLANANKSYVPYNIPMIYGSASGTNTPGTGYLLTNVPVNPYHCANKKYVDETIQEIINKEMGDFNVALDAILAIQNKLIGGAPQPSVGLAFESNGDGTCAVTGIGDCTDTDIVIPEVSPDGDRVTSIGDFAFSGCRSLTSIVISGGVTSIGSSAFEGCRSLTSINIPDSVTYIGDFAFRICSSLTSIDIPDSVTSIGNDAFEDCSSLTSVTIGDSVTWIGDFAFSGCRSLKSIVIPDGVTSIGYDAFGGCSNLTDIYVPWSEGGRPNAPWGATNATIHYNSEV